jgi:hypothetical protein
VKSTYKILSSDLDRMPIADNIKIKTITSKEKNLFHLDETVNLFDFIWNSRILTGTQLLSEDMKIISSKISSLYNIKEIFIEIDYFSPLIINNKLFLKRILQALQILSSSNSNFSFVIVIEESKFEYINNLCKDILNIS